MGYAVEADTNNSKMECKGTMLAFVLQIKGTACFVREILALRVAVCMVRGEKH
jgi:hypothetical protein